MRSLLPCLVLSTLVACSSGPVDKPSRRTLANGAVEVNHSSLANTPGLQLSEELRIGVAGSGSDSADDPFIFGDIRDLEVGLDGTIYVLDYQAAQIRMFDSTGEFIGLLADKGEGPGELGRTNGIRLDSDGFLWVNDHGNRRVTLFDSEGAIVREMPWRARGYGYSWRGMGHGGRYWYFSSGELDPAEFDKRGVVESTSETYLTSLGETEEEDVSVYLGSNTGSYLRFPRGTTGIPFSGGGGSYLDPGGHVWMAASAEYKLVRMDLEADTTLMITASVDPAPVSDSERTMAIENYESMMERMGQLDIDWSIIPSHKPMIGGITGTAEGGVWVRRDTDTGPVFDIFAGDGTYGGTADAGALGAFSGVEPVIRGDRIWGKAMDRDGTPVVIRARLMPADR
ncbi:MAG: 6-bladed beta-propeller [Rhodothermales bacterium]|nr:6-bladed beta-propeller [Rhodothermales bacterium]MBO6779056.1 6-bladed beta-propeller [Rhodothermales bacterium]